MRLTLRTLLAWIDDVLAPEDHRRLGVKVAASQVAPRLVERIASVVGNPAISAPNPAGRGLADDPDTAAEFLDNVLDPERLEAFERICIESDVHLADVAGCHRILAEVIREPAAVEPLEPARRRALLETARQRLQDSSHGVETIRIDTAVSPAKARPVALPRRRPPLAAWLSVAVAALLLAGLGGFLIWTLLRPGLGRPPRVADEVAASRPRTADAPAAVSPEAEPAAAAVVSAPSDGLPAIQPPPAASITPEPPPPAAPVAAPAATPDAVAAAAHTPTAAPDPAPKPSSDPAAAPLPAARSVPFGDALAIGGGGSESSLPAAAEPGPGGPAEVPGDAPGQPPVTAGTPTLLEGVVLVRRPGDEEPGGWRAATAAGPLATSPEGLDVLVPAWTYAVVGLDGATVRLHPGSSARVSGGDRGGPRLALAFGRAVAANAGGELRLAVAAGGLEGMVVGPAGRPVGIDVACAAAAPADPAATAPLRSSVRAAGPATAWRQAAADGAVRPLIGIPVELLIPQATALCWDARDPAAAALVPEAEPAWMRAVAPGDRTLRHAARDLAAALAAAPEAAAVDTLRRQSLAGRAENRMIAAATLAFLGDGSGLADLLCEEPPRGLHESQWLALEEATVPVVVARGGAGAESLLEALRTRAPAGCGEELAALARGLDSAALPADPGPRLLDDLESPSLAVRRFAIIRLRELVPPERRTGDDYRADRPAVLRTEAVQRWRQTISPTGGAGERGTPRAAPPRRDDE